jgi:hypothetical protein
LSPSPTTRNQIGGLIKREVDDYYRDLSFFKKIFISRERIYQEVDDLVHATMPRRVDEYLRGAAFANEATNFLNATVDNFMSRPLSELVGQVSSERFEAIRREAGARFVAMARSPELEASGRKLFERCDGASPAANPARIAGCFESDSARA